MKKAANLAFRPWIGAAKLTVYLSILVLILIINGCLVNKASDHPLKAYYFPEKNLVYTYDIAGGDEEYWEVSTLKNELHVDIFNKKRQKVQTVYETISPFGSQLKSFELFSYDDHALEVNYPTKFEATILHPDIIGFDEADSSIAFVIHLKWAESDSLSYELLRNRRFKGYEKCIWQDKTYNCARFLIKEELIQSAKGSIQLNTEGYELYAKDIGLIERFKRIDDKLSLRYNLRSIDKIDDYKARLNEN